MEKVIKVPMVISEIYRRFLIYKVTEALRTGIATRHAAGIIRSSPDYALEPPSPPVISTVTPMKEARRTTVSCLDSATLKRK